jgi:hypothetical protein
MPTTMRGGAVSTAAARTIGSRFVEKTPSLIMATPRTVQESCWDNRRPSSRTEEGGSMCNTRTAVKKKNGSSSGFGGMSRSLIGNRLSVKSRKRAHGKAIREKSSTRSQTRRSSGNSAQLSFVNAASLHTGHTRPRIQTPAVTDGRMWLSVRT